ncbi:MAG: hypothetical protein HPY50_04725 [Firmicutes bacterium]|nr:hypothetical protein [Bacillota bacterium]
MQIVNCKNCGKEIARVDATTLEVYEIRAGDERPIPRVDGKGNSVDRGKLLKQQPSFHLDDRWEITEVVENKESGATEEKTTYEPLAITCGCGEENPIL